MANVLGHVLKVNLLMELWHIFWNLGGAFLPLFFLTQAVQEKIELAEFLCTQSESTSIYEMPAIIYLLTLITKKKNLFMFMSLT